MPILARDPATISQPCPVMSAADKAALLAYIIRAQSVGATILSTMSRAKKLAEAIPTGDTP